MKVQNCVEKFAEKQAKDLDTCKELEEHPLWIWIAIGAGALVFIGAIAFGVWMTVAYSKNKKEGSAKKKGGST